MAFTPIDAFGWNALGLHGPDGAYMDCPKFYEWEPTLTPKEHRERQMEREHLELQAAHNREMREWQERQADKQDKREDRRDRRQLLVLAFMLAGVVAAAVSSYAALRK